MKVNMTSTNPVDVRPPGALRPAYRLAVLGLLMIIAAQIFLSTRQESQTFDESDHLYAGYEYWKHADFGRNPEHPPFAKLVAAIALLPLNLKVPVVASDTYFKRQDFVSASKFLYGADADSLLARGRGMMLLFTLGLALAVFATGREMFSPQAGLLALTLFTFEPMLLANGGLVTTDMALSCMLFVSVYAFYRYIKQPTPLRLALMSIAVGLALVAKQSGVFLYLVLGMLAIAELLHRQASTGAGPSQARSFRKAATSLIVQSIHPEFTGVQ
jgi:dolichyl-phosphate-mannose--protein O-mannosyl transferase